MAKVAVVTDSTAYLPQTLIEEYDISVLPLGLIWEGKTYRDGVDIQPQEFYERLQTAKELPTSSQASTETIRKLFASLLEKGNEVLGIFISSKLSGTFNGAKQARELLKSGKEKIAIFDSLSTSMEMGFQVLAAARAAKEGASLAECEAVAANARKNSGIYFVVETLEFLHRGGRIGGAARLLGTMLNLKPLLAVIDGRVEGIGKTRTKRKATRQVVDLVAEKIGEKSPVRIAALHINAEEEGKALLAQIEERFHPKEAFLAEVSPVIGTHVGPGAVGLAYVAGV
jgi:DegV family protein with EDD domain